MDQLDAVIFEALLAVAPEADPAALAPERPFRDQIDIDSVDFLNFVLGLEKRLNISVPDLEYPQLSTLSGCRAFLARAAESC
ncbi:acyl carrier protein [Azospirillum sp.]|uniref:acyl carrier protein n=1 Tax=Azospirillum sp. TaxID=34012 RepID=UPI003D70ACCE